MYHANNTILLLLCHSTTIACVIMFDDITSTSALVGNKSRNITYLCIDKGGLP